MRATVSATNGSPPSSAATAARWMKGGAQEVLYSTSLPSAGISGSGALIQPSRQPVIAQVLENELIATRRSPGSAISRKAGAAGRSNTRRS